MLRLGITERGVTEILVVAEHVNGLSAEDMTAADFQPGGRFANTPGPGSGAPQGASA